MRLVLKQRFSEFFDEKVKKDQHRSLMMKMMALEVSLCLIHTRSHVSGQIYKPVKFHLQRELLFCFVMNCHRLKISHKHQTPFLQKQGQFLFIRSPFTNHRAHFPNLYIHKNKLKNQNVRFYAYKISYHLQNVQKELWKMTFCRKQASRFHSPSNI